MKKKMETSKKIILASYIIAGILSAIVIIGTFMGHEADNSIRSRSCVGK